MKHFGLEILVVYDVLGHFGLYQVLRKKNCFKYFLIYILGQMLQQNPTRKRLQVFSVKMTRYLQRF